MPWMAVDRYDNKHMSDYTKFSVNIIFQLRNLSERQIKMFIFGVIGDW
jgi:hypothetical protein